MKTLNEILFEPTSDGFIQFLRYVGVGGVAFLADGASLFLCVGLGMHYLVAAVFGFMIGLSINYYLSKLFVFRNEVTRATLLNEFVIYGVIGVAGLGMTEFLMYFCTEKLGMYFMISKVIAAALVLVWNFGARKVILYREK